MHTFAKDKEKKCYNHASNKIMKSTIYAFCANKISYLIFNFCFFNEFPIDRKSEKVRPPNMIGRIKSD